MIAFNGRVAPTALNINLIGKATRYWCSIAIRNRWKPQRGDTYVAQGLKKDTKHRRCDTPPNCFDQIKLL